MNRRSCTICSSQLAFVSVLVLLSCLTLSNSRVVEQQDERVDLQLSLDTAWQKWKLALNKQYSAISEELHRHRVWTKNQLRIDEHNRRYDAGLVGYRLAMNIHGDLTDAEFKQRYSASLNDQQKLKARRAKNPPRSLFKQLKSVRGTALPEQWDCRRLGLVTPVKDQGKCGSCYAFSTTGSLEGQWAKKTGNLISFSEQQIIDCSLEYGDHGCYGGLMDFSFAYIQKNGITTSILYPYTANQTDCKYVKSEAIANVTGYIDIPTGDEFEMQYAVVTLGPVSVAIDVDSSFRFYKSGVFDSTTCKNDPNYLNHAVLVVGFGIDQTTYQQYWTVKNSWNQTWGEDGYIRFARNKPKNLCGIADMAVMPVV